MNDVTALEEEEVKVFVRTLLKTITKKCINWGGGAVRNYIYSFVTSHMDDPKTNKKPPR